MIKNPSELYLEIYIHDIYERSSLKELLRNVENKRFKIYQVNK